MFLHKSGVHVQLTRFKYPEVHKLIDRSMKTWKLRREVLSKVCGSALGNQAIVDLQPDTAYCMYSRACFYASIYSVPTHLRFILQNWTLNHLYFISYRMIFIYCNWVSTRWQWSVNLYKNRKETATYGRINNTQKIQNSRMHKKRNTKQKQTLK